MPTIHIYNSETGESIRSSDVSLRAVNVQGGLALAAEAGRHLVSLKLNWQELAEMMLKILELDPAKKTPLDRNN